MMKTLRLCRTLGDIVGPLCAVSPLLGSAAVVEGKNTEEGNAGVVVSPVDS